MKIKETGNFCFFFLIGLLLISMSFQNASSQERKPFIKSPESHHRGSKIVDKKKMFEIIDRNTKSFRKDDRGSWLLDEDFESGNFPPTGWSIDFGTTEWQQATYSAYGNGSYSTFYSNYDCNYSDNSIYTSSFSPTVSGDKLYFDYAYAPYDDGNLYYDDLEIFYYDDIDQTYYSLIYYPGDSLQTAPGTSNYFEPTSGQWGTRVIDIPENATKIYFKSWENCGNNIYIDNVKIGQVPTGSDASVENVWAKGKLSFTYGVPDTISALIKNNGATTITNLTVYLNITGANNHSDSVQIASLPSGDTAQVNFNGYTPVLSGFSDVTVSIPPDDITGNNTATFLSQSNSNSMRYVDSNCCNSAVGWFGQYSFLNRYRMSGTGQIRNVNIKLPDGDIIGQIVYAIVLNSSGTIVGKSSHFLVSSSDVPGYKSFAITDPKPYMVTNDYYYVGIAQTECVGSMDAYASQQFNNNAPARPDANFYSDLGPIGSSPGAYEFPREWGQNYAIEAVIGSQAATDAGVSDLGPMYNQYYSSTSYTPVGKVFNAGTSSATFNVRRTITPGGYTSTKTVTGLASGVTALVSFDPWTFTSGTTYTVRDSILTSDGNNLNNQMSGSITPRVAKQLCVLWSQPDDRDSLVRAINADGRYANNFDTVRMNYVGSFRPWKIVFANFRNEFSYSQWIRDSLKSFLDNSISGNKKSLIVFANKIANLDDPGFGYPNPADSIFYRQYLRSKTLGEDWPGSIPSSQNKFRGIGFFSGVSQDSLSDPSTPELIVPTNGSIPAFKPMSVTGNGNDSCNAVCFAGTNYNTFFMTNKFSSLRASSNSLDGPVLIYTKIIDWLQSTGSSAKFLDLTMLLEGFYDSGANAMIDDTVRIYLRNSTNPFAKVDSAKAKINSSGIGSFVFNNASNGVNYYLQIKHRNALETWSKTPQQFSSNHMVYDFTTASTKAYGDNMKQAGSKWVVFGGDPNADGSIDLSDITLEFNDAANFLSGYLKTDLNGDDFVDLSDVLVSFNNSSLFVFAITPLTPPDILAKKGIVIDNTPLVSEDKSSESSSSENRIDNEIYELYRNVPGDWQHNLKFIEQKNGEGMKSHEITITRKYRN